MTPADRESILRQIASVDGIEDFLLDEVRKATKICTDSLINEQQGKACGYAYVTKWLEELSSDLNINLTTD